VTFTNPIIRSHDAADPWIVAWKGSYYFTCTTGGSVDIWKSATLTGLDSAPRVTVWRAPAQGPNSRDVWAPELHYLQGRWYVYYSACDGSDDNRRQFVLQSVSDDPMGPYVPKGRLDVPDADMYAIDGSVLETAAGKLYYLWSGRLNQHGYGAQNIFIAPMSDPWTISGKRVLLSSPTYDWETHGWQVNEGPEVLRHGGKTFIIYSASGGSTPDYCLGMLTNVDGDLLNPASWSKSSVPVFEKYVGPDGVVYTPGHNGFCTSPDGKQDWIIYHGKENTDGTWGGRKARAQPFLWTREGTPFFGHPVPAGIPLALPGGEAGAVALPAGRGKGLRVATLSASEPAGAPTSVAVDPFIGVCRATPATGGGSIRWAGEMAPRFTETYTLQAYSAGGVRVWVDGKPVIDNWNEHPLTSDQCQVALTAGRRHTLRVEYRPGAVLTKMMLAWSSAHQPFEVIPSSCLFPPSSRKD